MNTFEEEQTQRVETVRLKMSATGPYVIEFYYNIWHIVRTW